MPLILNHQVSNATGRMKVEEVPAFAQADLADEDVMLLDTYTTVFVWVGAGANAAERGEVRRRLCRDACMCVVMDRWRWGLGWAGLGCCCRRVYVWMPHALAHHHHVW